MRRLSVAMLFIGLLASSSARAWFFFWLPLGGAKPSSTSPVTSDNKEAPAQSQSSAEPPKPVFHTPVKEEASAPALAQPSTTKIGSASNQMNSQILDGQQSSGAKKLLELKGLLDQGLINQRDYDAKKSEILKGM